MRIAAISVAPVFPNQVIGGSQKILADVAAGLKRSGHDIQIWCTGTEAHSGDFEIDGVPVHPVLRLRGAFPATHQITPSALAQTANRLSAAAEWADRVYLHADAVYLRHAIEGAEIVRSIHDFVYEEALLSTLTLPADSTIVPSEYLKRCIETTVAFSGRESIEPVVSVPNGIKVPPTLPESRLPEGISPREESDLILLFPHRPEPTKGIHEAMLTAGEVQRRIPDRNVRLLIPTYPTGSELDAAAGSAAQISELAKDLHVENLVELHDWLNPVDMPGYYAAGDVTLCLGAFIESFGLVPIESVANGAPAVCARVGALRQYEGVQGISMVAQADISAAVEAVSTMLEITDEDIEIGRSTIASRFSFDAMISGYENAIAGDLGNTRDIRYASDDIVELAPWCEVSGDLIYDDYAGRSQTFTLLAPKLSLNQSRIRLDQRIVDEELRAEIMNAVEQGILVRQFAFD
ncbi:glycosyltransferase [Candidatus Lucifugimonas marina]|uniref:Glycosyltransferase n=1 Tax=Candidatus Lucifugimonas marina TaxID=3038979 RepID=A0AAJ5ZF81_9CHLR|nr:glycosyltransferase [SAR202 cluster bacterium JH1073]